MMQRTLTAAAVQAAIADALQPQPPAVVVHLLDPLRLPAPEDVRRITEPRPLGELAPLTTVPFIAVVNGEPVLRAQWWRPVQPGDQVVFIGRPQGKGSDPLRTVLSIALMIALPNLAPFLKLNGILTGVSSQLITAGGAILGGALINAVVPPARPQQVNSPAAPSPTYNTALQGNAARPYASRPVGYGLIAPYPDFAAPPYSEFDASNDQYFCAILNLGEGFYDFDETTDIYLGNTPLSSFEDVQLQRLDPGELASLTLVKDNMVIAPEVADAELLTGERIGPFAVCRAGWKVTAINLDFVWPKGLYPSKTTEWTVEARQIDERDNPVTGWSTIGTETLSADTVTPQRRSYRYTVAEARYQVRVTRTDTRVDDIAVAHDQTWVGLRGELANGGITADTGTLIAVRMRGTKQLAGGYTRKLRVKATRRLPIWDGSSWSVPTATRSIVWAWCDILRNSTYGRGEPDSRIDLERALVLDALYTARGDSFDYVFDSKTTSLEAAQVVARAGRAASLPPGLGGKWTLVRDQQQTLPVAAFDMRTIERGSFQYLPVMRTEESADALEVEYFDDVVFDWRTLPQQLFPGVVTPENVRRERLVGITNRAHALREAKFMAATDAFGRERGSFGVAMDGLAVGYGNLIAVSHDLMAWGLSGEVTAWDAATRTATLSEPPTWDEDAPVHYVSFTTKRGLYDGPHACDPGPTPHDVVLREAPGITPYTGSSYERTRFRFGAKGGEIEQHAVVLGITPRGGKRVSVQWMLEDNRRHTADADIVDTGYSGAPEVPADPDPPSSTITIGDHFIADSPPTEQPATARYTVGADGTVTGYTSNGGSTTYSGEWISDAGEASLFDVRFTNLGGTISEGTTGAWLSLETSRAIAVLNTSAGLVSASVLVEIRDRVTLAVRDSATVTLYATVTGGGE